MKSKQILSLIICGAILGSIITLSVIPFVYPIQDGKDIQKSVSTTINIKDESKENIYKAIIAKSMPSVVGITTVSKPSLDMLISGEASTGVGTGVIIDSKGYILTNSHVINDGLAKKVNVLFNNSESTVAEVLWFDKHIDLAVIKVEKNNLDVAELGDSDKVEVGDISVAIGNPLGLDLERTVTEGIISGLDRTVRVKNNDSSISTMDGLIQTSAAINFGNSGGPLLNSRGQVIGINTVKAGEGEGLGFAIPINIAKPVVEQFKQKGSYKKVQLGVNVADVEEYQALLDTDFGIKKGVIIIKIENDSVAKRNNLQINDVIIEINGTKIEEKMDLLKVLYTIKSGDTAKFLVWRDNKEVEMDVKF